MKGWDGGRGEWEMEWGKDVERRYKIARRHCWSTQQTCVLTSTCTFTGTFRQQHENKEGRRKDSDSRIEGWALQGSCGARGSQSLGRKWLKGDTVGSRRGRSKAEGKAGSKDSKWVKRRISNKETEVRNNNRRHRGEMSEDVEG